MCQHLLAQPMGMNYNPLVSLLATITYIIEVRIVAS